MPRAEILSGDRYQVKAYYNLEVCAQIDQHSAAMRLAALDNWLKESKTDKGRVGLELLQPLLMTKEPDPYPDMQSEDSLEGLDGTFRRFPIGSKNRKWSSRKVSNLAEPSTKRPAEAENNATTMPPKDNVVANVKFR